MLMIQENEAPEVHRGSRRWEKRHGKVNQQKGIALKQARVQSCVSGCFVLLEGQEGGGCCEGGVNR